MALMLSSWSSLSIVWIESSIQKNQDFIQFQFPPSPEFHVNLFPKPQNFCAETFPETSVQHFLKVNYLINGVNFQFVVI